jgi:hypothetical protein
MEKLSGALQEMLIASLGLKIVTRLNFGSYKVSC